MPNSNQINNLSPNFRDLLLNMNLPLRDTVVDNSLTTYLNGVGKPFVVNHINKLPDNNNLEDIGDIQLPFSVRKNEYQGESKDYEKRGITTSNDFTNPLGPYSLTSVDKLNPVPIIFAKTPASKIKEGLTPFSFLTGENKYKTNVTENKFNNLLETSKSTQVDISLKNIYASPQDNSAVDVSAMAKKPETHKASYLDDKGNLNLGGGSTQPFDIISSVVNGGGFGLNSQGGIIDNADIRSSLAGRALTGLGVINDTPLGVIGGKQLLIQLGNNAIKNVQKESLGKVNTDVLSLLKGGDVLKPNYEITIPSSGLGKVLDFGADLLGFQLPISVLSTSASIWSFDDNLDPTDVSGIVRANEMLKNSGKGQVLALFKQMKANLTGKCRPGYAPAFEDKRIPDAIKPNEYSTADKLVRHGSKSGLGIDVFAGNYNRRRKVIGNSVLEDTGHVKIARYPSDTDDSKRYMFSIENLAYSDNLLKACEKGPYGGKIMWFPPYDISFSEQSNVNWEKTYFIGRGEPMFTYNNTERTGNLSWKIIIDFPNYAQQFTNSNNDTINGFYAGCWDDKKSAVKPIYELATKANEEVKKEEIPTIQNKPEIKNNTEPIVQETFRIYFPNDVYDINKYPNYENGLTNSSDGDIYLKAILNVEKHFNTFYTEAAKYSGIDTDWNAYDKYILTTFSTDNKINSLFERFKKSVKKDIDTLNKIPDGYNTVGYPVLSAFTGYYDDIITTYPYKNLYPKDLEKIIKELEETKSGGTYFPTNSKMYQYYKTEAEIIDKYEYLFTSMTYDEIAIDKIINCLKSFIDSYAFGKPNELNTFFDFSDINHDISRIKTVITSVNEKSANITEIDYVANPNGDGYGCGTTLSQGIVSKNAGTPSADKTNFGLNGKGNKTSKDRGNIITVENVDYDGWWDPKLKTALKNFLKDTCPHCKIYINGYASIQGGVGSKNNELSQKRADNIKDEFLKDIIEQDDKLKEKRIVTTIGEGATEKNANEKCSAGSSPDTYGCKRNRFVNIEIKEDEKLKAELSETETNIGNFNTQPTMQVFAKRPDPIPEKSMGYSECDYFEKLNKNHNFIYEQLREKIKHFSPSFHSTTPEGFNSRLTFLHQCTRQGSTIYDEKPDNLSFGKPPVCILRLGDFYYTKIIIDSISFTYEPLVWDMNPEGIGMQPMIANVDMSFSFIGGSSMDGPIVRLQNAVSHNFYANTNVYDDRAETNAKDTENEPELPNIKSEYKPLKLAADTEVRTMGEKNLQDIKLNIEYDNSGFSKGNLYGTISIEKESDRDLNIVLSVKNQDIMSILLKKGKKSVKFKTEKNMGRYPWDEYFYAFFLKEGQQYGVVDFNLDIIEESVKKQFLYNWEPYFKGDKNDLNGGKLSPKAPDAPLPVNNNVKPEDKTEVDPKAKTEQDATEQKKKEKEALEKENYDKISTELIVKSKEDDNYGYGEGTGIDLDAATIKANEDSKIDFLNKKSVNTTISKTTPIVPIEEIDKKVLTNSSGNVTVIVVNKYTIIK